MTLFEFPRRKRVSLVQSANYAALRRLRVENLEERLALSAASIDAAPSIGANDAFAMQNAPILDVAALETELRVSFATPTHNDAEPELTQEPSTTQDAAPIDRVFATSFAAGVSEHETLSSPILSSSAIGFDEVNDSDETQSTFETDSDEGSNLNIGVLEYVSDPTFTFRTQIEQALDGAAAMLDVQAYSDSAIAFWYVEWGDGTTDTVYELADALKIAHYYQVSEEDALYPVTLTIFDAQGQGGDQTYQIAVVEVPGGQIDTKRTFMTDEFYDAEKSSYLESRLCWGAGTANILYYTGWADETLTVDAAGHNLSFESEDDVYEYVVASFDNTGSSALYGYEWFITGKYDAAGIAGWAQPESGTGGFYPQVDNFYSIATYSSYASTQTPTALFGQMAQRLTSGSGVCAALAFYADNPGSRVTLAHTISVWGFKYDEAYSSDDPRYYTAITISDSDNNAYKGRNAPDTFETVAVEWSEEYQRYKLTNYQSGECWLEEFITLRSKESVLG